MMVLIDAGHGGLDVNGKYTTDPKKNKMYKHPDFTIYEGVTNRRIATRLMSKLHRAGIAFIQIHDDVIDIGLTTRCNKANAYGKNCLYLSIHSNAGKGKGFEIFTSPGQTKSDWYAEKFYEGFKRDFPEYPFRADMSDGDHDKEERFTVLVKTIMPAVLVELLFFDEINQAKFLMSDAGQERLAESLFQTIKSFV